MKKSVFEQILGRFANVSIQVNFQAYRAAVEERKREMATIYPAPTRARDRTVMAQWRESVTPRLLLGDAGFLNWALAKKEFERCVIDRASGDIHYKFGPIDITVTKLEEDFPVDIAERV
jgi:hypothetical protein